MQFLQRHRHALLLLVVAVLALVLVVRQHLASESAHAGRLEDFIVLVEREQARLAEHRYQRLVQELPHLNERSLVADLQRTALLVNPGEAQPESLIWKYHVGVHNELKRRAEQRVARLLQRAPPE
jgi:hypothetical protein